MGWEMVCQSLTLVIYRLINFQKLFVTELFEKYHNHIKSDILTPWKAMAKLTYEWYSHNDTCNIRAQNLIKSCN